ncbi:MAG: hypothetical protein ACLFWM_14405 [Actinomycetota bacterium]
MTDPARLPVRRRVLGAVMGGLTIVVLALALWQVGRAAPQPEAASTSMGTAETAPSTVSSTITIETTTIPTTSPSTAATVATTVPTAGAPTTEPASTTTLAPLVLEPDGLDVVSFGAGPEETIAAVSARLGGASSDSGWVSSRGVFGTCPGSIVRVARWESLRVFFTDGPTEFGEDATHFFYYIQSTADAAVVIDLTTVAGIGIGSTVEELTEAYGTRTAIDSSSSFGATFTVESQGPGLLSGTLTESVPRGQVTSVAGGFGCGA